MSAQVPSRNLPRKIVPDEISFFSGPDMSGEHAICGLDLIALGTKTTIDSMVFVYDLYKFP